MTLAHGQSSAHAWTVSMAHLSSDLGADCLVKLSSSAIALHLSKLHFSLICWFSFHQAKPSFVLELLWKTNHQGDLFHLFEAFWYSVFKLIAD
jgi:hypothetical protein